MESNSIGEILDQIRNFTKDKDISSFGLFFRGQSNYQNNLRPSIFRQGNVYHNRKMNEKSMLREFNLLKNIEIDNSRSIFEQLIQMQHYGIPTRLLDWSQNLLVALYFAIQEGGQDGALFVIDPLLLNQINSLDSERGMCDHINKDVIIRANLACSRELKIFLRLKEIKNLIENLGIFIDIQNEKLIVQGDEQKSLAWQKAIKTPIAVKPPIRNDRQFLQRGVFTLHGGIMFGDNEIVKPTHIEELENFDYLKIKIPCDAKINMQEELELCGINEASLFPELEHQSQYIRKKWTSES
jgi:hypothetical protein